jgi:hypothetical protein
MAELVSRPVPQLPRMEAKIARTELREADSDTWTRRANRLCIIMTAVVQVRTDKSRARLV